MKVKDLKIMLSLHKDEQDVVFLSTSGVEWKINSNVLHNPKTKEEKNQVVIYIK